jgi:hypothetical protein
MLLTSLTEYALLWVALAKNALPEAIAAGLTLYLIGAIVGLFNRLCKESGSHLGGHDRAWPAP